MGLFTINFELGDKTLETLTRISSTSVLRFELGPETRSPSSSTAAGSSGPVRRSYAGQTPRPPPGGSSSEPPYLVSSKSPAAHRGIRSSGTNSGSQLHRFR